MPIFESVYIRSNYILIWSFFCRFVKSAGIVLLFTCSFCNVYASDSDVIYLEEIILAKTSEKSERTSVAGDGIKNSSLAEQKTISQKNSNISKVKSIIGISFGAVLGAAAGVAVMGALIDCEGMGCFLPFLIGLYGGGTLGAIAGENLAASDGNNGVGVYFGFPRPDLNIHQKINSTSVNVNSGFLIGFYYNWCFLTDQCIGPFIERTSFSINDDLYLEASELGLRYKKAIVFDDVTINPGFGISTGQGEISEQTISKNRNTKHDYTSFRVFSDIMISGIYGEMGVQWFRDNKIGDVHVSPHLYVMLGVEF